MKELNSLRSYNTEKFKDYNDLTFNESVVYYLSEGNPAFVNTLRNTSINYLYKYYILNRIRDLNSLSENISYLTHLKKADK